MTKREKAICDLANRQIEWTDELEMGAPTDKHTMVSEGDENGAWVRAWVWVSFNGTALCKSRETPAAPKPSRLKIDWQRVATATGDLVELERNVEIGISRGCRDDVLLQRLVERKIVVRAGDWLGFVGDTVRAIVCRTADERGWILRQVAGLKSSDYYTMTWARLNDAKQDARKRLAAALAELT